MSYNVAFVGTREAGGFEGVVTWSSYASKEEFDAAQASIPEEDRKKQRVVEEGISPERCIELVKQTPAACYVAAAFHKAKLSDGSLNPRLLNHELTKAYWMISQK